MSAGGAHRTNVDGRSVSNGPSRRQSLGGADISKSSPNGFLPKRTSSFQFRSSLSSSTSTVLKHAKGTSKSFDGGSRSLDRSKILANGGGLSPNKSSDRTRDNEINSSWKENTDEKPNEFPNVEADDSVSGLLYDMLQKEVAAMRVEKEQDNRAKRFGSAKAPVSGSQVHPVRYIQYPFDCC